MSRFGKIVNSALQPLNLVLARRDQVRSISESREERDLAFLQSMPAQQASLLLAGLKQSKAQLRQDLFVLSQLDFKRNGFFVEFGAASGVELSNSFLLESEYGWTGILSEPALCWHETLKANRSAAIETRCVWKDSRSSIAFHEVAEPEFSKIAHLDSDDLHAGRRKDRTRYDVPTISLLDLLRKYDAPRTIDYLSIDTEGSEFEILNAFDFNAYTFSIITCEHNYTPMRAQIHDLLTRHGYERRFEQLSEFDDWYVRRPPV